MTTCSTNMGLCAVVKPLMAGVLGGALVALAVLTLMPGHGAGAPQAPVVVDAQGQAIAPLQGLAVMNLKHILEISKAGKGLKAEIEAEQASMRAEIDKREAELKTIEKKLEAAREQGQAEEFVEQRRKFKDALLEARRSVAERKRTLDAALGKAMGTLRGEVTKIAADIGAERGYTLVLTRGNVVVVAPELDITADVLATLDAAVPSVSLDLN